MILDDENALLESHLLLTKCKKFISKRQRDNIASNFNFFQKKAKKCDGSYYNQKDINDLLDQTLEENLCCEK